MTSLSDSQQPFSNKIAIVTGGGSGIGLATCIELSKQGATVIAVDRDADRLALITNLGDTYALDVSDRGAVGKLVDDVSAKHGRIDVLVLAAGINGPGGHFDQIDFNEIEQLYKINVFGSMHFIQLAAEHLEKSKGNIVLIGSINGSRTFGWAGAVPYTTSKAAILALGRALAVGFGPRGIRVNTVCPGQTDTNIHGSMTWTGDYSVGRPKKHPEGSIPLTGRESATVEDVASAILFLASDAAKHITGTEIFVDGGQSLI
jgi:NAD(P)-dependent dehydrogenase (short-subunit alcohol dehydrogenase family)